MVEETAAPASLDDFPWEAAATARTDEDPGDFAGDVSERFRKLWAHNAWIREPSEALRAMIQARPRAFAATHTV